MWDLAAHLRERLDSGYNRAMRHVLQSRPLRLLFAANAVSMIGSGMNSAAVIWYILQATHSEKILGALVVAQAIPPLLLMPFSGVIIDREDRRHLVIALDAVRGLIILSVALLCFRQAVQVWHLFVMNVLVSTGFWMFWPIINALLQELTPEEHIAESNGMLMAGFQGGWLIAGAVVGFVYNKIGIGGILLIDATTYVFSIACYSVVRSGRHVVRERVVSSASAVRQFWIEMREGFTFVGRYGALIMLGVTWATFVAAMMLTSIVTAPVSDRILHYGAVGYGWLNAGWGFGAFAGSLVSAAIVQRFGWRKVIPFSMLLLAAALFSVPFSRVIYFAAALYFLGGLARGAGGVALSSSIMALVPKHYMGRVQNLFSVFAIALQVSLGPVVGTLAHNRSLVVAISLIAVLYVIATSAGVYAGRAKEKPASEKYEVRSVEQ